MRATHRLSLVLLVPLAALALPIPGAHGQQVYQWKDAKGVTHYSDSPPAGQKYQDRRIDARGGTAPPAQAGGKSVEDPQCTQARQNLALLSASNPVMQAGADGKPTGKALDETQRANQRSLAEAAQKAYCTPAS